MATTNYVSVQFSDAERDTLLVAIASLKDSLSFLKPLSAEKRQSLAKLGDKSRAFVEKALDVALQHPDILPRAFDLDEMQRDVDAFRALYAVAMELERLQRLVDDTVMALGSDAYSASLAIYTYAKANQDEFGLESKVDDLSRRFSRSAPRSRPEAGEATA